MALIVMTLADTPDGPVVSVVSEPAFDATAGQREATPAQVCALSMLATLEQDIKQDRGLVQLLS